MAFDPRRVRTFLAPRALALEALLGLILAAVGISLVFSLGAALIVLGLTITAMAVWPFGKSR